MTFPSTLLFLLLQTWQDGVLLDAGALFLHNWKATSVRVSDYFLRYRCLPGADLIT
jgi:hypothetical protein